MNRTILQAVRAAADRFDAAGIETASLDADVLMRHLLDVDRTRFLLIRGDPLPAAISERFDALVARRLERISVAYLIGEREFLGMPFVVGPGALVPRPETELLVEWAARWLQGRRNHFAVDVGTGSGAIAIGLTHFAPIGSLRGVVAIEPSHDALEWARRNRAALAPDAPIAFVQGHLVSALRGPIDLVLANLPYLTPKQADENRDLHAEPRLALVSGEDGLDLIRELLADLPRVLTRNGAAILELDPSQAEQVARLAKAIFTTARVSIVHDLAHFARFVTIERTRAPKEV